MEDDEPSELNFAVESKCVKKGAQCCRGKSRIWANIRFFKSLEKLLIEF